MKKTLSIFSMLVTIFVTLASCGNDEFDAPSSSVAMSFMSEDVEAATRAAFVTSMSSFGLSCSKYSTSGSSASAAFGNYFINEEISNKAATKYFWPGSNYKCSFYAYYPYGDPNIQLKSTTSSTGAPTYSLTVPKDISKQVDFCVAEVKDVAGNYEKKVTLPFSHACSSLSIKVKNTGTDAFMLESVTFYGVKLSGTYSDGTWNTSGDASTASSNAMTITSNTSIEGGETLDVSGTSNKIIVIPQTIAADTEILDVLVTYQGEKKHYYYKLSEALTMEKGTQYSYSLHIYCSDDPYNGHPYVDLGLPSGLKWATCNIGAELPWETGLYFAWGETVGYTVSQVGGGERSFSSSVYSSGSAASISTDLSPSDGNDAARVNMGGKWRMPTNAEFQELINNCTYTLTYDYNGTGVEGVVFTSKENENSLFFPLAGQWNNTNLNGLGRAGIYWSASLFSSDKAWTISMVPGAPQIVYEYKDPRYYGQSVRGVCE